MSKLVSLSKDGHDLDWFASAAVFEWVADFVRARVDIRSSARSCVATNFLATSSLVTFPTRSGIRSSARCATTWC